MYTERYNEERKGGEHRCLERGFLMDIMDNKERIMQCGEELFYAKGYDAAGVQEIVDMAGVTKPTLYYYFGSKRGLLEAILDAKAQTLKLRVQEEMGRPGDIKKKLHCLADVYYDFFQEEHKFYLLLMALFYSARENEAYQTVKPYLGDFYRLVRQFFENASRELGNMNGRQEQFAISFIGALNQFLVLLWDQGTPRDQGQRQIDALVDQYLHGIFS